jgi:hypothetical protein
MNLVSFSFIPPAGLPERRNIGSLEDTMKKNYLSNIFCLKERSRKKIWFISKGYWLGSRNAGMLRKRKLPSFPASHLQAY